MVKQKKQNSILSSIFQSFGILTIVGLSLLLLFQIIIIIFFISTTPSFPSDRTILKDLRANTSTIEEYDIVEIHDFESIGEPIEDGVTSFMGNLRFTYGDDNEKKLEKISKVSIDYAYNSEESQYEYKWCVFLDVPDNETIVKDLRANISTIEEYNIVKIYSFKSTSTNEGSGINFNGSLRFTYEDGNGEMTEKASKVSVYYSYNREKYKYGSCTFLDYQEGEE